jgi:hypothetical protein
VWKHLIGAAVGHLIRRARLLLFPLNLATRLSGNLPEISLVRAISACFACIATFNLRMCRKREARTKPALGFPPRPPGFEPSLGLPGIFNGHTGTGAGFIRAVWVSLPVLVPQTIIHLSSVVRGWYNTPTYQVESFSRHPHKRTCTLVSRC